MSKTRLDRSNTWTEALDARYRQAKPSLLVTAFASVGIIYGDIGTSPLYVLNGIFPASQPPPSAEDALGAISAIIWTLTFVPLFKYALIALEFGTGEGEGGPFALFAQMYPPEKEGSELALPSIHSVGDHVTAGATTFLTRPYVKPIIKVITLFAVALILSDGILTPAVSVTSAVSGIAIPVPSLKSSDITGISIAILVVVFFSQRFGTNKLGMSFAPIVTVWLALLTAIGIYNITRHPDVFRALDPSRAIMFFVRAKSLAPLSGILLAITGVEALFANLGQFSKGAIRLSFISWIYPALVLAYLGQGAALITDGPRVVSNIFYQSIPGPQGGPLWWITFVFGLLATVVASQAMITASFSLIQQMVGFKSFPPVAIIHTSDRSEGQIYAPVVNFLLLIGTVGVTAGFGADDALTSAYGFAVAGVLISTTFLMTLVMIHVKGLPVWLAMLFFVVTGFVDAAFFASSLKKIPHGAWFTLTLGCLIGLFLLFWTWAKGLEDKFDAENRIKLSQLLIRYSPDLLWLQTPANQLPRGYGELDAHGRSGEGVADVKEDEISHGSPRSISSISPLPLRESEQGTPSALQISDLALHEEPENPGESEKTEHKPSVGHSDSYQSLPPVGGAGDSIVETTPAPQQRITIEEPEARRPKQADNSASLYPPVQVPSQLGNLKRAATTPSPHPTLQHRKPSGEQTGLILNPAFSKGITLSGPLPRLECFSFFHHLGAGIGAPHSFSALLRHQPALPRVVVFLSIRVVGVPHLQEEDKYLIDKLRTLDGFYLMTYRVGYRDTLDLRGLSQPTLERIVGLERGIQSPGTNPALEEEIGKILRASQNINHILPHYHCTSKSISAEGGSTKPDGKLKKLGQGCYNWTRAMMLEEVYRRVSQNFPETSNFIVDESKVLRIGINALI